MKLLASTLQKCQGHESQGHMITKCSGLDPGPEEGH